MRTVVGLYDRFEDAQQCVRALKDAGFDSKDISLVASDQKGEYSRQLERGDQGVAEGAATGAGVGAVLGGLGGLLVGLGALAIPGIGPIIAAGPLAAALAGAGIGAAAGGVVGALVDLGIPEEQAHIYAEGVRRGGTLVTLRTEDERADQAVSIMNRFNPVDLDQRAQTWRGENWTRFDENAGPYTGERMTQRDEIPVTGQDVTRDQDFTIPVIDEEIDIDKREVQRGGMRVETRVEEEPVSKDVNLRKEHIDVERRPVNREATDADFKEGSMELRETEEEAFVSKQARVTEEVRINKDVTEETETVQDTLRHQRVDVTKIDDAEWQRRDPMFRQHHQTQYGQTGMDYPTYMPAYRFGYALGMDTRYKGNWNRAEQEARHEWELSGNPGSWNEVRDAIRYGFDAASRQ